MKVWQELVIADYSFDFKQVIFLWFKIVKTDKVIHDSDLCRLYNQYATKKLLTQYLCIRRR